MKICPTIDEVRKLTNEWRRAGERISFVPTMGYLHEGHLSLVRLGREHAERVVVSIFVNPAQFNNPADLEKYPRDEERDFALLRECGVDAVFLPTPELMYSTGHESWVDVEELTKPFEGAGRPGHFRGVTTVVTMLFNVVQPDCAVFGEKDFQQLRVVERMVCDLKMPIEIVRGPLVREEDGVAMSSRNVRLDDAGRKKARLLSSGLKEAQRLFAAGERKSSSLVAAISSPISEHQGTAIDYIAVIDEETLQEQDVAQDVGSRIVMTVEVDGVRLLDNMRLKR